MDSNFKWILRDRGLKLLLKFFFLLEHVLYYYSFTKNLSVFRRDIYNSLKEVIPDTQVSTTVNEMMV